MPIDIRNSGKLPTEIRVFYSWQSDLEKKFTRTLIKKAIRSAISRVNQELPDEADCTLILDSGVDGRSGSPNIAEVIFDKVHNSQIIVGDVSIIARSAGGDGLPNPNVLAEMLYGVGKHGWSRVIGVINDAFGKVEELPFDIRGHRMAVFTCGSEADVSRASRSLEETLLLAIRAVVEEIDHGPADPATVKTAAVKRARDLRMLRDVLTTINSRSFELIESAAARGSFWYDSFYFWEGFRAVVDSVTFNLYDKALQARIENLRHLWGSSIEAGETIFHPGRDGSPVLKDYQYFGDRDQECLERYQRDGVATRAAARDLYSQIHNDYPEIDVSETDAETLRLLEPYLKPDANNASGDSPEASSS